MAVIRSSTPATESKSDLQQIMRLEVPVIVKLAERNLAMSEVLRLGVGSIIEFVKSNDEPLQLMINNRTIAIGEAVKVGENFGLRIKQVGTLKQLVTAMGSGLR
jgi:flagellar motor switch protein FliN/FliY